MSRDTEGAQKKDRPKGSGGQDASSVRWLLSLKSTIIKKKVQSGRGGGILAIRGVEKVVDCDEICTGET